MYIVRFLHQTTTTVESYSKYVCCISSVSYIKPQLIDIGKFCLLSCISSVSYIKPQLCKGKQLTTTCCISSVSYIKPQLSWCDVRDMWVVYRPFPTSNHNCFSSCLLALTLYIVRFLHQTTTSRIFSSTRTMLYIVRFLHQTTTDSHSTQLPPAVVYRPFPTSNHNRRRSFGHFHVVVYRPFPTSNHNLNGVTTIFDMLYIVRFLHQTTTCLTYIRSFP